ncbi:Heat stress transcription factor A-7a [Striga hermonthica]|uniref:Heat stress transcription factor A-7a n=1 Tax=Striga hermonthica TaxID=68872 RepID=A0A9N7R7Z5_STRHE|nr:Heat stress transcription factor A-7a [Striga hermonthica]
MDFEMAIVPKNFERGNTSTIDKDDDDDDRFTTNMSRKLQPRPPPFLTKTFDMVNDPETNSYITWNSTGSGFIIWDHNKFSAHVLPTVFKTSNFSSFVYQLNSYGFRKISWERYEYANQWFQAGKRHWLKNIKRRNQLSDWAHHTGEGKKRRVHHKSTHVTIEAKLDNLITEQNDMRRKIQKLGRTMIDMESQLAGLEMPRFQELENEKIDTELFLKRFMEYLGKNEKLEKGTSSGGEGTAEQAEENKERSIIPVENPEKCIKDPKVGKDAENEENIQCWTKMMENDGGFESNKGNNGDLADIHSKVMMEFDEMMESSAAVGEEIMIVNSKPSNLDGEDEGHIDLWII